MHTGAMTAHRTPWSPQCALERVEGDRELLRELIDVYLDEMPQLRADLRAALDSGAADGVRRTAHTIKGAVLNFAADAAGRCALELELLGRGGDLTGAPRMLAELDAALDDLTTAMQAAVAGEGREKGARDENPCGR